MKSFTNLLHGAIDYAGLFPPASLDLRAALSSYAAYRQSGDSWALGRVILPFPVLAECEASSPGLASHVSVLLGADYRGEIDALRRQEWSYDTFECKVTDIAAVEEIVRLLPRGARVFVETDAQRASSDWIAAVGQAGAAAKVRTGGVVPEAIPATSDLAGFLSFCVRHHVPFKATAGLHHPIRAAHALTYDGNAPVGVMHGFVNVMVATAMLSLGAAPEEVCAVLTETCPDAFAFGDEHLTWGSTSISIEQIDATRQDNMQCFGSCSFTEPMEDSRALGWLS